MRDGDEQEIGRWARRVACTGTEKRNKFLSALHALRLAEGHTGANRSVLQCLRRFGGGGWGRGKGRRAWSGERGWTQGCGDSFKRLSSG